MKQKFNFFAKISTATVAAFAIIASVASCISIGPDKPANIKYFVLSAGALSGSAGAKDCPKIPFAKVSIPAYLDIPQIVTRNGNEVVRDEQNRWGESLSRAVSRELATRTASAFAKRKDAKPEMLENKRITVSIERFDGTIGGNVAIEASFEIAPQKILHNAPASKISQHFSATVVVPATHDTAAYVHALDEALTELASAIAQAIQ